MPFQVRILIYYLGVVFGFREVGEGKKPSLPLGGPGDPILSILQRLTVVETDMNWVKRFMWLVLALLIAQFFV